MKYTSEQINLCHDANKEILAADNSINVKAIIILGENNQFRLIEFKENGKRLRTMRLSKCLQISKQLYATTLGLLHPKLFRWGSGKRVQDSDNPKINRRYVEDSTKKFK